MNGFKFTGVLAVLAGLLLGGTQAQAGDIYAINASLDANASRVKEVKLKKGDYVATVNVEKGDSTKVELEAELVQEEAVQNLFNDALTPKTLTIEFTVDKDNSKYEVTVRNTSDKQIKFFLKLRTKD